MGNCHASPPPNKIPYCDDEIGAKFENTGFCTQGCTTSGNCKYGDSYRKKYCSSIGDSEYIFSNRGKPCQFDSCHYDRVNKGNCCGSLGGYDAICKRESFKGDPFLCCLRDKACQVGVANNDACYQDSEKQRTCPPVNRDITSNPCRQLLFDYCIGKDVKLGDSQQWMNRWLNNVTVDGQVFEKPCVRNLYRNLYNNQGTKCQGEELGGVIDPKGLEYSQDLFNAMIQRYVQEGGNLAATESSESNNAMNSTIFSICEKNPIVCKKALNSFCASVTTNTIIRDTAYLKPCGCYMPNEQYSKYTDLYGISRECSPPCSFKDAIPQSNPSGTEILTCKQSTCVIDDISIQIANSIVGESGGGINFNQICNSCSIGGGTGTCNCTITGSTIYIIDSEVGTLDLNQVCSSESICTQEITNEKGEITKVEVPCTSDQNYVPDDQIAKKTEENRQKAIQLLYWKIFGVIILLIIIGILIWFTFYYFIQMNDQKNEVKIKI